MEKISELIYTLRESYILEKGVSSYKEINSGICVEFAEEIEDLLVDECEVISNDRFMNREDCDGWNGDYKDIWNEETICEYGGTIPGQRTVQDLNNQIRGYHSWIYFKGKHYDAECPLGVSNLFDLPFFQRHLNNEFGEHKPFVSPF